MFVSISDFTGKFQLHTGMYDQAKLQDYITRYEERYLVQLLGKKLYEQFVSAMNEFPLSPNYTKIVNPFIEEINLGEVIISNGIKDMLLGFIYFEYAKDLINQMTPFGNVAPMSENSTVVTPLYSMIYNRYNESIKTYRAIQKYIVYNYNAPVGALLQVMLLNAGTGYDGYEWTSNLTQGTGTGGVLEFTSYQLQGVKTFTLAQSGSGYNAQAYPTSGGTGSGCSIFVGVGPGGVPNSAYVINAGDGYSVGDVLTIVGGNNDQTIVVDTVGNGEIQNLSIADGGQNYSVGDVFTLASDSHPNTGQLGIASALKVSSVDYSLFNGVHKEYAYWL